MKNQKTILVTGGAGYIGSHTVKALAQQGYDVVVLDNLENGYRKAVAYGTLCQADLRDKDQIREVFKKYPIDGVVHFAAYASVPDSVVDPAKYFENNVAGGLNLLACMREAGVDKIIFSSTAAVYGEPEKVPIVEDARKSPTNPYGWSKLQFEQVLDTYDKAYGIRSVRLRYFCAAGADPDGELGEDHKPETHVIPMAILTALGRKEHFKIFGEDYPTPDGTGVRDFIHVSDLAAIHVLALSYLFKGGETAAFNCGNEVGYSVREIVNMVEKVTGLSIPVVVEGRRPGDPAILVADPHRVQNVLGFKAKYSDLETIVTTSWKWYKQNPNGYEQ